MEGFYNNVIRPREEFLISQFEIKKKQYVEKRLKQVDFLIDFTKTTPEKENQSTQNQITFKSIFLDKIEDLKKNKTLESFWDVFPKTENISPFSTLKSNNFDKSSLENNSKN